MSGQVYEYLGTVPYAPPYDANDGAPIWFDLSTNTEQIGGAGPGPTDTWLFTHNQDVSGYPIFDRTESFGTLVLAPNVNVTLAGLGGSGNSFSFLAADKVIVGPGASFTMDGTLQGNDVIIAPGATATFNKIPTPNGGEGSDVANLINSGTLLVGPEGAPGSSIGGPHGPLMLGGPGFVQTSGFTSGESEVNDGAGHTVVTLGNIAQGSVAAVIDEFVNNAPVGGAFSFLSPGGGFTLTATGSQPGLFGGPPQETATIGVNTAALGSHVALIGYTAGGVHDTLTITDRIVAA